MTREGRTLEPDRDVLPFGKVLGVQDIGKLALPISGPCLVALLPPMHIVKVNALWRTPFMAFGR